MLQNLRKLLRMGKIAAHKNVSARSLIEKGENIFQAEPEKVEAVAYGLEAALAIGDRLDLDQPMALSFTYAEIAHFVAYMRQLDCDYRYQADFIERCIRPSKRHKHELKDGQKAAPVVAANYERLTGKYAGIGCNPDVVELPEVLPGDVPVAEDEPRFTP